MIIFKYFVNEHHLIFKTNSHYYMSTYSKNKLSKNLSNSQQYGNKINVTCIIVHRVKYKALTNTFINLVKVWSKHNLFLTKIKWLHDEFTENFCMSATITVQWIKHKLANTTSHSKTLKHNNTHNAKHCIIRHDSYIKITQVHYNI